MSENVLSYLLSDGVTTVNFSSVDGVWFSCGESVVDVISEENILDAADIIRGDWKD